MIWTSLDTWIVVTGALCALACALPGNYLVLRRMSMVGDGISHAVLPGLAAAFLFTGSRGSWVMFAGAAVVGIFMAVATEWVHKRGQVEESASLGTVFTLLFALGLVIIVQAADRVDLDANCVLFGAVELTPLDTVPVLGFDVPRAALRLLVVLLINLGLVVLFYKELLLSAFDEQLAAAQGMRPVLMHYMVMAITAVTTVAAFEAVGSILAIAMLIVPAATAWLLTHRLSRMIALSLLLSALSAVGGHLLAITLPSRWGYADASTAGMMAVCSGLIFLVALLLAPRQGVLVRVGRHVWFRSARAMEDCVGYLYREEEYAQAQRSDPVARPEGVLSHRVTAFAAEAACRLRGWVGGRPGAPHLTDDGRERARALIRSHRLWEDYLHRQLNLDVGHLHASAEVLEHVTGPALAEELARDAQHPDSDPQGRPIP